MVAGEPEHIEALVADAEGRALTVTVPLAVAEQPPALVAVTLYVVVLAGLTLILGLVAPVLHT